MKETYEYGWRDPKSGRVWLDGYQPVYPGLIFVRRLVVQWEAVEES